MTTQQNKWEKELRSKNWVTVSVTEIIGETPTMKFDIEALVQFISKIEQEAYKRGAKEAEARGIQKAIDVLEEKSQVHKYDGSMLTILGAIQALKILLLPKDSNQ